MSEVYGYTPEEARAVLDSRAFRRRDPAMARALFSLQLGTGARVHEALSLKCGDVFEHGIRVKNRIWFKKTKNGERRAVDLPPELVPLLARWGGELAARGFLLRELPLFVSPAGRPVSRFIVYRMYQAANRELKLKNRGTHSARKAWATAMYDYWAARRAAGEGVDPLVMVQKLGGWKDINSCARYVGINRFDAKDGQAHIGALFFRTKSNK